jgi:hypothetical protein
VGRSQYFFELFYLACAQQAALAMASTYLDLLHLHYHQQG